MTTEEMFALYNAILDISGDPGIGLKLGSEEQPEHYSPIAIAALYSRSFREALNRIARYKRLTSPQEIRIVERGKECAVEFVWLLSETTEAPTLIDTCFRLDGYDRPAPDRASHRSLARRIQTP